VLTIWGRRLGRLCDGLSRRDFLRIGALGGGFTLADWLRLQAADNPHAPTAALPNKSVIMIFLLGGPSHLDTYDLKPDAPAEYRGEFKPIRTNVAGIQMCELFPRQAAMMDRLAIIRSIVSNDPGHGDNELVSGYNQIQNRTAHHPPIGAVVSRLRGTGPGGMPPSVSLRRMTFPDPLPEFKYDEEAGFLGMAHRPFMPTGPGMADLQLPDSVTVDRLEDRRNLLHRFDQLRRDLDASGTMTGLDVFQRRALEMVTSSRLRNALDLSKEDPRLLDRYWWQRGRRGHGEQLLLARRLIEAGAGFVSLALGYWDTHQTNFPIMRQLCSHLDQSLCALIEDLHQRGLDRNVLVVVWGEFGRTPKINKDAGRDHWVPAMSAVLAGGGLTMGQVVGATDARGEQVKDRPYRVPQVLSTIYRVLGIDPARTFPNHVGRPVPILDDREPVGELL
jgi:hypothetical protein